MIKDINNIIALSKRKGFVYPGSEIYGGFANSWDYGPLGVEIKNNIKNEWWKRFVHRRSDILGLDASLIMNPRVWEASGHTSEFIDPMIEDLSNKKRYRLDSLLEDNGVDVVGMSIKEMSDIIKEKGIKSPNGNELGEAKYFNLMFETNVGPEKNTSSVAYLRPETAQAMFVNFKNVVLSNRVNLPFGIAQIGKAFRNEITPGNFIFRTREFEQMEIEYFIREKDWEDCFEAWIEDMFSWVRDIGIEQGSAHKVEIKKEDRAHYSKRTIDIEYDFPFGRKELYGLAYRGNYDLKRHIEESGENLYFTDPKTNEKIIPHVIEPTFGVERTILAILVSAYSEEETKEGVRTVMRFKPRIAPYKIAVLPLIGANQEMVLAAREVFEEVSCNFNSQYDAGGSIGKRYRRQDEAGTPICATIDADTLKDGSVTLRDRDSMEQIRVLGKEVASAIAEILKGKEFKDLK